MKKSKKAILAVLMSLTVACSAGALLTGCSPDNDNGNGIIDEIKDYGTVSGVVKSNDVAVAGVKVAIGSKEAVTDANGNYSIESVEIKDEVSVTFSKTGYVTKTEKITKSAWSNKATTLNVSLVQSVVSGTISGTVKAYGVALGGVKVAVGSNETVTSATGAYTLEGVEIADSVTVTVSKTGYVTKTLTVAKADWSNNAKTLDVELKLANETATLTGKVTAGVGGEDIAVEGATVTLGTLTAQTDSEGKYSIAGVSIAETVKLDVTVTHPFCEDYSGKISVTAGDATVTGNLELTATVVSVLDKTYFELDSMQVSSSNDYKHVKDTAMWAQGPVNDEYGRVIIDHGEGICLHVDNNKTADDMVTTIYNKMNITAANSKMMFRARGFLGSSDKSGLLAVRVIDVAARTVKDLQASDGQVWQTMNSNGYIEYHYDFSEYNGKDVVIVIGAKQGNHNAIDRIRFISANENWLMPFTTAADIQNMVASVPENLDGANNIKSAFNGDSWNKIGDQGGANEGWLMKDADYAPEDSTNLRVFTYKKLTLSDIASIVVRARTFSGQNSVTSGASGQIYPQIIVKIIDSQGNIIDISSTYNKVDNGESCENFYFKLDEAISGDYTFVIGMARGQRLAIESIKFGGVMTSVNVTGKVLSAGQPVEGATVKYGYNRGTVTTAADGTFTLPVDISSGESVGVVISKEGFADINRTVSGAADAALGDLSFVTTILPNLTTDDIAAMTALTETSFGTDALFDSWRKYGNVDKHGEGTCLQANANSIAYICAKISIDDSKKFMKFNARMFVRDEDQRGLIQVKVIKPDGSVDILTPVRVYNGNTVLTDRVLADGTLINREESYTEGVYDLTAYVGTDVVIAIIGVNHIDEVTKAIHNAINDVAFKSNSDTEFGKPAYSAE